MDSNELKGLFEAYNAVHDQDLRQDLQEELSFVDSLTDIELNVVVEEIVQELVDEGYNFDQVEELFEDVIGDELEILEEIELVSDYLQECGLNEYGAHQVLNNPSYYDVVDALFENEIISEARAAKKRKGGKSVEEIKAEIDAREKAKAEAKKKPTVKAKVTTVKASQPKVQPKSDSVKDTTATSAWLKSRREKRAAQKQSFQIKAGEAKSKERAKNITKIRKEKEAAIAAKGAEAQRRARNIRNIRVGKAVRKGIAQAQVSAYSKGRQIAQSAKDTAGRLTQSAKNRMSVAKRGLKKAIGGVASKVASGASKIASRMSTEEVDIFDVVLEFLQTEGIVETVEEAQEIMVNELNAEDIDAIVEATYSAKAARAGKDIGKPGKQFAKIAASAAKRYGSKERGEKVAGAVLAKLRAKRG